MSNVALYQLYLKTLIKGLVANEQILWVYSYVTLRISIKENALIFLECCNLMQHFHMEKGKKNWISCPWVNRELWASLCQVIFVEVENPIFAWYIASLLSATRLFAEKIIFMPSKIPLKSLPYASIFAKVKIRCYTNKPYFLLCSWKQFSTL